MPTARSPPGARARPRCTATRRPRSSAVRSRDLFVDEEEAERLLAAVEEGETFAAQQAVHRRSDGTELVVAVSAVSVGDGREALLVAHDTGEVGRIGERLGEVEAKYRSLTSHLPVVTYVRAADADGAPTFVSPQIDRLLGYTAEEWLADPGLFARLVHPDDRDRVVERLSTARERTPTGALEYRLVSRDGRTVWVRDEAAVVSDARGRPLCVQGSLLDVTDRKTADEDRKALRAAEATATSDAHDRQRKVDFVAAASAVLSSSLDYRKTLEEAATLAVRELADSCVVDVREEDGRVVRLVAQRAEPPPSSPEPDPEPEADVLGVIRDARPLVTAERIIAPARHARAARRRRAHARDRRARSRLQVGRPLVGARRRGHGGGRRSTMPGSTTRSRPAPTPRACSPTSATASSSSTAPVSSVCGTRAPRRSPA